MLTGYRIGILLWTLGLSWSKIPRDQKIRRKQNEESTGGEKEFDQIYTLFLSIPPSTKSNLSINSHGEERKGIETVLSKLRRFFTVIFLLPVQRSIPIDRSEERKATRKSKAGSSHY